MQRRLTGELRREQVGEDEAVAVDDLAAGDGDGGGEVGGVADEGVEFAALAAGVGGMFRVEDWGRRSMAESGSGRRGRLTCGIGTTISVVRRRISFGEAHPMPSAVPGRKPAAPCSPFKQAISPQ